MGMRAMSIIMTTNNTHLTRWWDRASRRIC
jgi:hypothetical protein